MDDRDELGAAEPSTAEDTQPRREGIASEMQVREEDLEPHAGLRYIARLFKVLAILLLLLLIAEIVIGVATEGGAAVPTLMVEATRLIVFAGLLWGLGDMALMLVESNHDLRATRILVGRLNGRVTQLTEAVETIGPARAPSAAPPPTPVHVPRPEAPSTPSVPPRPGFAAEEERGRRGDGDRG